MNTRLNLSSVLLIMGSWSLLFVSTSIAGCINDPGQPPIVCPIVEGYTGIVDCELSKYYEEALQCCRNPIGSSSWTTADWASFFGVHPIGGYDIDRRTNRYYELAIDGAGNCSWVLKQDDPVDISDTVHTRWVAGGSVDLTVPGFYFLHHEWYNEPVGPDQNGCLWNFVDDPVIQIFTVEVKRRSVENDPLPGFPPTPTEKVPYSDIIDCQISKEGEMWISGYAWLDLPPTVIGACEEAVSQSTGWTRASNVTTGLSVGLAEFISVSFGLTIHDGTTYTIYGECSASPCVRRRIAFYQGKATVELEYEQRIYLISPPDIICYQISRTDEHDIYDIHLSLFMYNCSTLIDLEEL